MPGSPPPSPRQAATTLAVTTDNTLLITIDPPTDNSKVTGYEFQLSANYGTTWGPTQFNTSTSIPVAAPADGFWMARVRSVRTDDGPRSDWVETNEVLVNTAARTTKASVSVTFLINGNNPIVGASVRWRTPDLALSGVLVAQTDDNGQVTFPVIATGPVVFTLSGGNVGTSDVRLEELRGTAFVQRSGTAITLRLVTPEAPVTLSADIAVTLPDRTPVPDATLSFTDSFSGTTTTQLSTGARTFTGTWAHPGWIAAPTTDANGRATVTGFVRWMSFGRITATMNDGVIQQNAWSGYMGQSLVEVRFEQMPVVRVVQEPDPMMPGEPATVVVKAVDGTGDPITGLDLTLDPTTVGTTSTSSTTSTAPTGPGSTSMSLAARTETTCSASLKGTTGSSGRVTFKVCPGTNPRWWQADGTGIVASRPVKVRLKPAPTQLAAGGQHSCARTNDGGEPG